MGTFRLAGAAGLALVVALTGGSAHAAAAADEAITITGCVVRTPGQNLAVDRSLIVWSKGDVMLTGVSARLHPEGAVGTSGRAVDRVVYWLDDEDDIVRHAGHQVEIVGEVKEEFHKGEIEIDEKDGVTQIEFEFDGKDVVARLPIHVFGRDADDIEFEVVVRRVDVEKVNVLSAPCR